MSKKNKNKISYYSLEDINKIGVVDNINCNEKSVLGIIDHSMPYLLILCITTIIPIFFNLPPLFNSTAYYFKLSVQVLISESDGLDLKRY